MTHHPNTGRQVTVVQLHIDETGETHYSESLYNITATGLMAASQPDIPSEARAFYLDLPGESKEAFFSLQEQQFMLLISGSVLSKYSDSSICDLYPNNIVPVRTYAREACRRTHECEDAVAFIVRF